MGEKNWTSTSTADVTENTPWDIQKIHESNFTIDELVNTLDVIDRFKRKYPNDEAFTDFEECVREEICGMFGGTIFPEY